MKKIFIILLSTVLVAGCTKKLDINPTQSIDEQAVFTSDANISAALIGAYNSLSSAAFLGGDLQLYSELLAADGEIRWDGTFNQPREIYTKQMLTNNSFITATYTGGYATINICNNILANLSVASDDNRDRVQGEALFLRALTYFEMAELFAQPYSAGTASSSLGLSLISTPTVGNVTEANYVGRSTLQETYDYILKDLTDAKDLLPARNGVYASANTVSAVLSRVYLQMGDYANARDEANAVITSNVFTLATTYREAFNNVANSAEDIFAMQVTAQDGANDMQLFWSTVTYGARNGDVDVLNKHLALYSANDERRAFFWANGSVSRSGKWRLQYRNLPVIRLAEMYLTRAEANFRLGTSVGAAPLQDINRIRARVLLAPLGALTLDAITTERKLELAHEGQAIQDVKRLKKTVDGFAYDAEELVLPIPIREINAVGPDILVQNPGY